MNDGRRGGTLRARMAAVIDGAARQGFDGAESLWGMSPAEAERALAAFAARRRAEQERDERLAWMIGYYAAVAVHAPRRFPRQSGTAFRPAGPRPPMTEAQMKRALLALADGAPEREARDNDT